VISDVFSRLKRIRGAKLCLLGGLIGFGLSMDFVAGVEARTNPVKSAALVVGGLALLVAGLRLARRFLREVPL
jgi:hypothetical protein